MLKILSMFLKGIIKLILLYDKTIVSNKNKKVLEYDTHPKFDHTATSLKRRTITENVTIKRKDVI
jgi:hypothetical protein|tara:strand:+ start:2655 stop:2849 length:195 start_codon:yes stop_codon:yes gene_type:complete